MLRVRLLEEMGAEPQTDPYLIRGSLRRLLLSDINANVCIH